MKKTLLAFLVFFTVTLFLFGCSLVKPNHRHQYSPTYDETNHFNKCDCGDVTVIEEHLLEWVVDTEATNTVNGTKHLECSCGYREKENTAISIFDKHQFINQIKQDIGSDTGEFSASPFAQECTLSFSYLIDVKIVEDEIYLNGFLYDDVKIANNSKIIYDEFILDTANKSVSNEECKEIIKKLQSCESCYLLETQSSEAISQIIAVHKIEGKYYFSSFWPEIEGMVIRIHYADIEREK